MSVYYMVEFKRQLHSTKWGRHVSRLASTSTGAEIFPMDLADMDIPLPQIFKEQFTKRFSLINNLTYKTLPYQFYKSIRSWYSAHHSLLLKDDWIIQSPSINTLYFFSLYSTTSVNDCILVTTPAYMKFIETASKMHRRVIDAPLKRVSLSPNTFTYQLDVGVICSRCIESDVKMLELCNPHNPGGRVWSLSLLQQLVDFCRERDILIYCDEICMDLSQVEIKSILHTVSQGRIIACNSVSKAFNVSSLKGGYGIIPHADTMARVRKGMVDVGNVHLSEMTTMFFPILYSEEGYKYIERIKGVIRENYEALVRSVAQTRIMVGVMEGSYAVVMDFGLYGGEIERQKKTLKEILQGSNVYLRHHENEYVKKCKNYEVRVCISVSRQYFGLFIKRVLRIVGGLQEVGARL